MNPKIRSLYTSLAQEGLDGLIVSNPSNISYVTGLKSRDAYAVLSPAGNTYITDSRYTQEVAPRLKGCTLTKIKGSLFDTIGRSCKALGLKCIGFEERHLPYAEYAKIKESLKESATLVPTHNLIEPLRQIKNAAEIEKIRKATLITCAAFTFIRSFLKPGLREIEVAGELERFIRAQGAWGASFEIIVAAGANASCPHHLTGPSKLARNELILIDMGVDYEGYKSDLTRVFFLGKINVLVKKIYTIALQAQQEALGKIKPGVPVKEIDFAARHFIAQKGYGKCFEHNLGHGIGLEVHESPALCPKAEGKLKAGMVFTVEPGIYLPGRCGVRIEDMVLVTQKGAEILSGSLNK